MKNEPKQVIVVRKDLNMRKGKIAAQAAHASMSALLKCANMTYLPKDHVTYTIKAELGSPLYTWLQGRFTKICVSVDSEQELIDVYTQAKNKGLLCSLITDAGLTEFDGVPTKTCCAIGPELPEDVDPITGHLKLL